MAATSEYAIIPLSLLSYWLWVSGFARRGFDGFPSAHGVSERVSFASRSKRNQKFAKCETPDNGGLLARVIGL